MFAKEKKLLKRYLKEVELDEGLAYSPGTSQRNRLINRRLENPSPMSSLSQGTGKEGYTPYRNVNDDFELNRITGESGNESMNSN